MMIKIINKTIIRLSALFIILYLLSQSFVIAFATGEITSNTTTSTTILNGTSSSTQHNGYGVAKTDGDTLNYTYTGEIITSTANLYDYVSDEELENRDPISTANGWADPYTRFNSAISANTDGTYEESPASDNLTIRFKTHVNGLTKVYIYLFDDYGHSTGWSNTPLTWDATRNEWNHTFIYDNFNFTPTKIIFWGDSSYGEWQTDDINCALAKGSSYLYDDAKEVTGTANKISISIAEANMRVISIGGTNKRDQNLHLRKKSNGNIQVNVYGGLSLVTNMTQSGSNWIANNINASSATNDIITSIRSDGYWDNSGGAQTAYYAETVPFVVTKGHNYTFNDWSNLTTGTAYDLIRQKNVLNTPLYFGCFYRGDNTTDYKLGNKANYSSFWWLPNMSVRGQSDASVQGLVDATLTGGNLTQDGQTLPYFDSSWVSGDVSRAGLMKSYTNIDFPFYGVKIDATKVKGDADATGYAKYYQFYSKDVNLRYDSTNNQMVETNVPIHSQGTQSSAGGTVGFYPFNTVDDNTKLNLGFGARFDISFKLNSNGKVETVDANGVPTGKFVDALFEFEGDDDVWVFIDDKLILDMGGCHKDATGVIDFAKRTAYVNNAVKFINDGEHPTNRDNLGVTTNVDTVDLNTALPSNTFIDGVYNEDKTHVLTMFYMERGMFESDLLVRYNFATLSNTNTFKIREITKFTGVGINAGLIDATKKAAEYDVWQYQITNTSNENGSNSGLVTPTYDTYIRTNQGLSSKLSGQQLTEDSTHIYFDISYDLDGNGKTWDSDGARIGAYLWDSSGINTAKTVLMENVGTHLYRVETTGYDNIHFIRIAPGCTTTFPYNGYLNNGDTGYWNRAKQGSLTQGASYELTGWNNSTLTTTVKKTVANYEEHTYTPNANNYVGTVNYLWTDNFSTKTSGTENNLLINTTTNTGILSLMYGTGTNESSAEFQRQFQRGSTMNVTQLSTLKTPTFNGNKETFTGTLNRNFETYYNTNVIVTDALSNSITRAIDGSFIYNNASGVSAKTAVQVIETFENTPKLGAITVTKTLQRNDVGNENNKFKMQLELKDIFGIVNNNISDYDDIEANVDIDSDGYFYMIGGQTVVISGVPYGTQYKITEVDSGDNYTQVSNTNTGYETVYEGSVTDDQSSVASNNETLVNVRKLGSLMQTKTVSSVAYPTGKMFSFTLTINAPEGVDFSNYNSVFTNGSTTQNLTGTTFTTTYTLAPGGSIYVSNLPYESTYQIVEDDSQDWTLIENNGWYGTISSSTPTPSVNFINRYDGVKILTIDKHISNYNATRDFSKTFTYTFNIIGGNYDGSGVSYTKSDSTSGTLNNADTFTLGHNDSIVITVPYGAICSVTEAADSDYTCTSGNYSGILTADDSFTFINHYDIPVYSLTINKVVENTDANDDFTFTISLNTNSVDDDRAVSNISITAPTVTETLADKGYTGTIGGHSYSVVYTIKKNQNIVISGIPEGTICTVSEAGVENYTAICSGDITKNGTKGNDLSVNTTLNNNIVLTFTNTYSEDTFEPYVLPAAGMEDMKPIIIIITTLLLVCTLGYVCVSEKIKNI